MLSFMKERKKGRKGKEGRQEKEGRKERRQAGRQGGSKKKKKCLVLKIAKSQRKTQRSFAYIVFYLMVFFLKCPLWKKI